MENNPIILSFDVGIIHLSYCLLTKKLINNKLDWSIIEWNNINLTKNDSYICKCGLKAFYTNIINNNQYYYCKTHSKNINLINPLFNNIFDENNNEYNLCSYINKNKIQCNKIGKNIIKNCENNTNYCKIHANQYYKNILKLQEVKKIPSKNIDSNNYDNLKYNLILELESRPNLLKANYVIIENQPSFKNPRMKSVATTLYDYYLIRGIIDKSINLSNIISVKFIAPSNKLKLINENDTKSLIENKANKSKIYKLTKDLGIKYCMNIINNYSEWAKFF